MCCWLYCSQSCSGSIQLSVERRFNERHVCDEHFQVWDVTGQLDGSFHCCPAVLVEEIQLQTCHVDLFVFRDWRCVEVLFLTDFLQFEEIQIIKVRVCVFYA